MAVESTPSNLYTVSSASHFQDSLSADLNRVSLLNFWAPWAEPCTQMNEEVKKLAEKHPNLLVLNVEAEEQEDIAESFEISNVPTFIILRGHTLLSRIEGADLSRLQAEVTKYARITPKPLSTTDKAPAAPTVEDEDDSETPAELENRLKELMNQSRVMLFMKGDPEQPRCGFSRQIVQILQGRSIEFGSFDILSDERVRSGLKVLNDWPTFPQLIVDGEFVGGLDIVKEMIQNNEFDDVVKAA